MKTKLTLLSEFFKELQTNRNNYKGFEVTVSIPLLPLPETIYNPIENLEFKRDYYIKAYDENLCLINNKEIQITNFKAILKEELN